MAQRPTPLRWRPAGALVGVLLLAQCHGRPLGPSPETIEVEIGGRTFVLEVALDAATRHRGLSGREEVPEDTGMLFVYPRPGERAFVMRECLVPLDIAFLDPAGRVLATWEMAVEPPGTPEERLRRYPSEGASQFMIEVRGGTLRALGLGRGDRVLLPYEDLARRASW